MELKEGEYYYWELPQPWVGIYWKREGNMTFCKQHICLNSGAYYNSSPHTISELGNLRPANSQEIAHLNACIAANKYVECPKEESLLVNSIYIW